MRELRNFYGHAVEAVKEVLEMTIEKPTVTSKMLPVSNAVPKRVLSRLQRFHEDESGVMVAFSIFLLLIIIMVGGIGVDLMRFEMTRSRLQSTVDRAVLAAADLDQPLSPTAVVNDYFQKAGMSNYLANVTVDDGLNYRIVQANAGVKIKTRFMRMRELGIPTLGVAVTATAEERIGKVEISMVLDISGSMGSNNKISNLRDAAKVFVDTVIRPENIDRVSLSLVPYSEHVNAGPLLFDRLNTNKIHNYSHCVEFDDTDFNSVAFDTARTYEQVQHFQWLGGGSNDRTRTACPRYDYERILPISQNATQINAQIDRLQPRAFTSIFLGMKWGAALLDPSMKNIASSLIAAGNVDGAFAGRPTAYADHETLKTIILMTDGENTQSKRITASRYDTASEIAHWDAYNLSYFLNRYVSSNSSSWWQWKYPNTSYGDNLLNNICNATKSAGIVVWSIGFEVSNHGADVMRNCASSPSHFFRVEGIEITDAFRAIARQINQLRLTN